MNAGFTATTLLAVAGVCFAQPLDAPPDLIALGLPLAGARLAEQGRYEVTTDQAFGAPALMVLRPTNLDAFPKKDTLPVLVWGNGGCAFDSTHYSGFLSTIASHGFLVLATAADTGATNRWASADDLRAALDWVESENERAGSPLDGRIATDQVAAMGQSCGGLLAIRLGADPRVDTVGVFNSGVDEPGRLAPPPPFLTMEALRRLHGPVLLVNGYESDFMMARSKATFDAIDNLPAFYGARHNAGHAGTIFHPGGGELANVASNWMMWWFKGNKRAGAMFVGRRCGLCLDPNWDVETKAWPIKRHRPKTSSREGMPPGRVQK